MRTYTDAERIAALAQLEANGGNVTRAARAAGVARPTLISWRNAALAAAPERTALTKADTAPDTVKTDWAANYGKAALLGAQIIFENLTRYVGQALKPSELRDVAVVAGIAVDKHLDYRDGRKSANVNVEVDARTLVVKGRLSG